MDKVTEPCTVISKDLKEPQYLMKAFKSLAFTNSIINHTGAFNYQKKKIITLNVAWTPPPRLQYKAARQRPAGRVQQVARELPRHESVFAPARGSRQGMYGFMTAIYEVIWHQKDKVESRD